MKKLAIILLASCLYAQAAQAQFVFNNTSDRAIFIMLVSYNQADGIPIIQEWQGLGYHATTLHYGNIMPGESKAIDVSGSVTWMQWGEHDTIGYYAVDEQTGEYGAVYPYSYQTPTDMYVNQDLFIGNTPPTPSNSNWFMSGLAFGFSCGCAALSMRIVRQAGRSSPEL
jgi:hypothetical protein